MDIALFSPSSLFPDEDDTSSPDETTETQQSYEERRGGMNSLEWNCSSENFHFISSMPIYSGQGHLLLQSAQLVDTYWCSLKETSWVQIPNTHGTGALAIYLQKLFCLDITTSDYDDQEIEENIAHNCRANGITPILPHVKHTWGDTFPAADPDWDLIIASDILLWLKGRTEAFKFFIEILSVLMLQSLLVAKTGDIAVCVNIFCSLSCSSWHC
ncbi:EEF1A lysine methyltransferase 3 isoform X3 [Fagus crenata]